MKETHIRYSKTGVKKLTKEEVRKLEQGGARVISSMPEFIKYLSELRGPTVIAILKDLSAEDSNVCTFSIEYLSVALEAGRKDLDALDAHYAEGLGHQRRFPDDEELRSDMSELRKLRAETKKAYDMLASTLRELRVTQLKHLEAGNG